MNLTIRILGAEVLAISTDPDQPEDRDRDLSGGELGSTRVEVGATDLCLGFSNGREVGE